MEGAEALFAAHSVADGGDEGATECDNCDTQFVDQWWMQLRPLLPAPVRVPSQDVVTVEDSGSRAHANETLADPEEPPNRSESQERWEAEELRQCGRRTRRTCWTSGTTATDKRKGSWPTDRRKGDGQCQTGTGVGRLGHARLPQRGASTSTTPTTCADVCGLTASDEAVELTRGALARSGAGFHPGVP